MKLTPEEIATRNARALALVRSWAHPTEEERAEQRETWAALRAGLTQSRREAGARVPFAEDEVEAPVVEAL